MHKFIFLCLLIFFHSQICLAGCNTGFACNLQEIQIKETQKHHEFVNLINKYFDKSYIEKNYITNKFNIVSYNDIFTFNTIL